MAGERLVKTMQRAAKAGSKSSDLVYGTIVTIDPLTVELESGLVLDTDFVRLAPMCTGLVPDDQLLMIQSANGQLFFALRKEAS